MSGRLPLFNPQWLARLHARAAVAPLVERTALRTAETALGSVILGFLDTLSLQSPSSGNSLLLKTEHISGGLVKAHWQIDGDLSQVLNQVAHALRLDARPQVARHINHQWRNEQLAVLGQQGQRLGTVERGAARALGLTTQAVHLVGRTPEGGFWVQQRALDKANDPGLWDTLMGGMVSANDTVATALARETWEEAGLTLDPLQGLAWGGRIKVRRPMHEDGIGYIVEDTDWYQATLPVGIEPVNQDGEVAQFQCLTPQALVGRLENDEFTLEAALILVAALSR